MEAHGGTLILDDAPEGGVRATIEIPTAKIAKIDGIPTPETERETAASPPPRARKPHAASQ